MPEPTQTTQLNKELRLHMAAVLYFLSRLAITAFVFAVPALYFTLGVVELPYVLGGAVLVGALFLGYYVAASQLRCAACASPVLMDNGSRKHPGAARFPGLNHRAKVAWDILFSSSYQCMYCVTRCRCKKSWGSKSRPARAASFKTPAKAPEPFSGGISSNIFGDAGDPVPDGDASFATAPPHPPVGEPFSPGERVVSSPFAAVTAFPDAKTVPVSLVSAPPAPPSRSREVIVEATPAFFRATQPVAPPVPWSIPVPDSSAQLKESPMNQQFPDPSSSPNPFLAPPPAAKTPVPSPAAQGFQAEFPYAPVPAPADGPPPWTIPSMPVEKTASATTPVSTPAPASVAPVPVAPVPVAPVPVAPVPVAPVPVAVAVAAAPAAPAPQTQLLREVVSILEQGQRTLAGAFESIITKLESHLSTHSTAPAPVPTPVAEPVPVAVQASVPVPISTPIPAPVPVAVATPVSAPPPPPVMHQPAPSAAVAAPPPPVAAVSPPPPPPVAVASNGPELPALLTQQMMMRATGPIPAQMRPQGKTTLVPLPVMPALIGPPPALFPPAEPVLPVAAPSTPLALPPPPEPASFVPAPIPYSAPLPPPVDFIPAPTPAPPLPGPAPVPFVQAPAPQPVSEPVPAPSLPPPLAPVPQSQPQPQPQPVADPAPRRRFARPSHSPAASQELNQFLQDAFAAPSSSSAAPEPVPAPPVPLTPPAAPVAVASTPPVLAQAAPVLPPPAPIWQQGNAYPVPVGNGLPAPTAPEPALPPPPPSTRRTAPEPHPHSPFGIAETPLYAPPGAPQEPAPFTFLKSEDGHFTPVPSGDPLEDGIMPWMQPVGSGGHARN